VNRQKLMRRGINKPGFTLLELLLVMLLIAVAAAIVAPSFGGFSRGRRLPNTAVSLVTTARWCAVKARSEGTTYRLVLDRSQRFWKVTKDDGTGQFIDETELEGQAHNLPEGINFGELTFQSTIESEQQEDYVTFKSTGRTDVVRITLVSDNDLRVTVACDMPLGTFHVLADAVKP